MPRSIGELNRIIKQNADNIRVIRQFTNVSWIIQGSLVVIFAILSINKYDLFMAFLAFFNGGILLHTEWEYRKHSKMAHENDVNLKQQLKVMLKKK